MRPSVDEFEPDRSRSTLMSLKRWIYHLIYFASSGFPTFHSSPVDIHSCRLNHIQTYNLPNMTCSIRLQVSTVPPCPGQCPAVWWLSPPRASHSRSATDYAMPWSASVTKSKRSPREPGQGTAIRSRTPRTQWRLVSPGAQNNVVLVYYFVCCFDVDGVVIAFGNHEVSVWQASTQRNRSWNALLVMF